MWSVVFLVPHVYWAAGSTVGLDGQSMDGVLAPINYVAIILSIIAAALALALVRQRGASLPHRLLLIGAWGACALLSLRGGVGLIQALAVWVGGSDSELTTSASSSNRCFSWAASSSALPPDNTAAAGSSQGPGNGHSEYHGVR
ncbi:hypothetical protein BH24CHL1_BH24CHL1_08330 [soil metagenome]